MPSINRPGRGARTPFKHKILDKFLGKIAGVISCSDWLTKDLLVVDMCAGDGVDSEESGTCSPRIITKHTAWAAEHGINAHAVLIEKNAKSFASLQEHFSAPGVELLHMDASDYQLPFNSPDNRFLHLDPNSAATMPKPESWGPMLNDRSLMLMTLGCNASGVKKGPLHLREPWFDYVGTVKQWLPTRFDILFVPLLHDSHHWAYLIVLPNVWRDKHLVDIRKWAGETLPEPFGVDVLSWRTQPDLFNESVTKHFLTVKEWEPLYA